MRRRRLLVLSVLSFHASLAAADAELPLELTWEAPPECASAERIRAELARIARVRPGRTAPHLAAVGRIVAAGGEYRLTLRTERDGVAGERSLASTECRSLEREVTLVLALAFGEGVELVGPETAPANGDTATQGAATPQAPSPATAPPGPPKRREPAAAVPAPETSDDGRRTSRRGGFYAAPFVGAGVLFGILPSVTPFGAVGAELGLRHLYIEPRVVWLPGGDDTLPRGVVASYDALGGSLSGCAASWSFDACLGVDVWALRGHSTGASEGGSAVAPYVAGVAALGWQWPPRGGIRFGVDAEAHVAFGQPRFVVEGLGEVHRVPRVSPGVALRVLLVPGG